MSDVEELAGSCAGWLAEAALARRDTESPSAPGETVTIQEYRALAKLRYLIRRFLAFSETLAREKGLTPQQHQALLAVAGCPPELEPTIGYLAERLQIKHHTAVELVDRLAEAGLVTREAGAVDRRQVYVRLTDRGATLLQDLAAIHRQELRSLAPDLVASLRTVVGPPEPDATPTPPVGRRLHSEDFGGTR